MSNPLEEFTSIDPAPHATAAAIPSASVTVQLGGLPAPCIINPKRFNHAQVERLYYNSPEIHKDVKSLEAFRRVTQLVEDAHGFAPLTYREMVAK